MLKIKELREKNNMTQQELAEKIGLTTGEAISQYESGKRNPSSDKIPLLAEALNCKIKDLFE